MIGNDPVRFGGGRRKRGLMATAPTAYPTRQPAENEGREQAADQFLPSADHARGRRLNRESRGRNQRRPPRRWPTTSQRKRPALVPSIQPGPPQSQRSMEAKGN